MNASRLRHRSRPRLRQTHTPTPRRANVRLSGERRRGIFFVDANVSAVVAQLSPRTRWGSDGASLGSVSAFSHDPAASDINLYRYCGNDPLVHTAPSGTTLQDCQRARATFEASPDYKEMVAEMTEKGCPIPKLLCVLQTRSDRSGVTGLYSPDLNWVEVQYNATYQSMLGSFRHEFTHAYDDCMGKGVTGNDCDQAICTPKRQW